MSYNFLRDAPANNLATLANGQVLAASTLNEASKCMNYLVSEEGIKEWDGCPVGCAEHIKTVTPLCHQKLWAFEEAQRQISRRQNRGDFSALGGNAFEYEYQRQLNAK